MPRHFSELKSGGGTIPMLSPHAEKWGDASPSVPHRSTPVHDSSAARYSGVPLYMALCVYGPVHKYK